MVVFLHHTVPQSGLSKMSSGLKQQQIPRFSVWLEREEKLAAHYEPHDWKHSASNTLTPRLHAVLGSSRWETGRILNGASIVCNIHFLLMLLHSSSWVASMAWKPYLIKHCCHGVCASFFSIYKINWMAAMFCLASVYCTPKRARASPLCAHLNSDDNLLAIELPDASFFSQVWIILIFALNALIRTWVQVYAIGHKYRSIVRFSVEQREWAHEQITGILNFREQIALRKT